MSRKHEIETYSKLGDGASFFLHESFYYLHKSFEYELAGMIFEEKLNSIEPSREDREMISRIIIPKDSIEYLRSDIPKVFTDKTAGIMFDSWQNSQLEAENGNFKFLLSHRIDSVYMLGHLNNFGFFIETLMNRHLLFLRQVNMIDEFSYSRISISKIMERIIYIFKDELNNNTIHLNEITNLFSLRNKTVHYTPDNAIALKPKISELIQIWTQTEKIIWKLEQKEKFNEERFSAKLDDFITDLKTDGHKFFECKRL